MYKKYIKRVLDFTFALILLILTLPITLLTSIAIKLESPGPVFFKQKRSGINGQLFTLMKYRSMSARNDVYDTSKKDEITRVGAFIRRFSIDELPQLLNILRGEMSFVGPRPWIPDYYKNMNKQQRQRYNVKPGITGLAQARGRNALSIHDKINSHIEYVQHITFMRDIEIAALTLRTMLDKSTLEIGKSGIKDELDTLKAHKPSTEKVIG